MKSFIFHLEFVLLVIVSTAPRLSTPYVITDVRLVEPWQPNSGRVQVQIDNSTWLDVCENGWDEEDGRVVCRQLGFPGLAQRLSFLSIAGQRSTESVRDFRCQGSKYGESSLSECEHESRDMMCDSNRGAGVTCLHVFTGVRLVEGQPNSGRVQVQINDSTWLDVCDNRWDEEDGRVVCRQLGFQGLTERLRYLPIDRQRSTESVNYFRCQGSESTLSECRHESRDEMCDSNRGAGVTCSAFPTTTEGPSQTTLSIAATTETDGTTAREAVTPAQTTGEFSQNSPMSPNDRDGTTTQSTAGDGGFDVRGGSNAGTYIGLAVGCVLLIVCTSVIVVCLLKRHKRSTDNYNKEHENSQGSNHLVLGELENSQAGQAALNVVDSSAAYDYCAVEGKGIPVDAGYVNAPTPALAKTRQAQKVVPKSVDNSAEYAYCAVEGREYSEVDAGHANAPTQTPVKSRQAKQAAPKAADNSAEYAYCAVEGKGIPVDAGYANAPTPAMAKTRQAQKAAPRSADNSAEYAYCAVEGKGIPVDAGYANAPTPAMAKTRQAGKAAPKSVDTSAEYAYCAVEGKGILEGSVDAEAGYLLPNPAPVKTSVNI